MIEYFVRTTDISNSTSEILKLEHKTFLLDNALEKFLQKNKYFRAFSYKKKTVHALTKFIAVKLKILHNVYISRTRKVFYETE